MSIIKNNKLLLKIFSALIAVVLWFAVTYTEDPSIDQHLGRLDTIFYSEDTLAKRGLIVVNKDELPSFSVTIRGKRSKVISSLEKVSAAIDVGEIRSVGEHEIDVNYIYPTDSIMLTKTKHSSVIVMTEKLVTREIPVKIFVKPNKKNKTHIVESQSQVETIAVSGAQSVMNDLAFAVVSLDESDITSEGTSNYPLVLHDKDNNVLSEENIAFKSQDTVPVKHTLYNKLETDVNVTLSDDLKNQYVLNVTEQDIKTVFVGVDDGVSVDHLEAVFGRKHLDSEEETISLEITAPDGVYIPEDSRNVNIKYDISRKSAYEIEVPVSAKNVPAGFSASINPGKIKVSVRCSKDDATADNISATIDAKKLSRDNWENVIVNVTAKDNIQIVGTYTVRATLK